VFEKLRGMLARGAPMEEIRAAALGSPGIRLGQWNEFLHVCLGFKPEQMRVFVDIAADNSWIGPLHASGTSSKNTLQDLARFFHSVGKLWTFQRLLNKLVVDELGNLFGLNIYDIWDSPQCQAEIDKVAEAYDIDARALELVLMETHLWSDLNVRRG
jgi:hypothetical protein